MRTKAPADSRLVSLFRRQCGHLFTEIPYFDLLKIYNAVYCYRVYIGRLLCGKHTGVYLSDPVQLYQPIGCYRGNRFPDPRPNKLLHVRFVRKSKCDKLAYPVYRQPFHCGGFEADSAFCTLRDTREPHFIVEQVREQGLSKAPYFRRTAQDHKEHGTCGLCVRPAYVRRFAGKSH